ncbi:hypothetical protein MTQ10_26000 [Streptomyces sp. XM83C]|nr:hypothetical protein [Streptomyces sp. XM83C]MCK1822957.1 hypothetical protein [Streptomyces sp. XM83C]
MLLEDVEGALWKQWMFEVEGFPIARTAVPPLDRLVVAVDPAVTTTDTADLTAFTVAGSSYPLERMCGDRRACGYEAPTICLGVRVLVIGAAVVAGGELLHLLASHLFRGYIGEAALRLELGKVLRGDEDVLCGILDRLHDLVPLRVREVVRVVAEHLGDTANLDGQRAHRRLVGVLGERQDFAAFVRQVVRDGGIAHDLLPGDAGDHFGRQARVMCGGLDATIAFGAYLPTDLSAALELVARGVRAGVLSLETGVRLLVDAGFPIEDAALEVERIRASAAPSAATPTTDSTEEEEGGQAA